MSECNDHWCEYYGKGSDRCDRCEKNHDTKDRPDLRVMLKRRADKQMELTKNTGKKQKNGQTR